jgi:hypothetical protein
VGPAFFLCKLSPKPEKLKLKNGILYATILSFFSEKDPQFSKKQLSYAK